jgi:8-oxo-dGTP pyrophosphatase MutT (NUDIX family)
MDGAEVRATVLDTVVRLALLLRRRGQAVRALTLMLTFADGSTWAKTRRLAEPSHHDDVLRVAAYQLMDAASLQRGPPDRSHAESGGPPRRRPGRPADLDTAREARLVAEALQPGTHCPGEVRFVFDGGTLTPDQVEAIRLPHDELSEYAFLETRDAVQRLRPVDGQIMLAAYRARLGNTATAHLADGRHILDVPALDRHDVHVRYRPLWDSPLHRGPVPGPLPVQQAWAWCFIPDGRVVLVAGPGPRGALPMLPGGTVERTDATPEDTLHREAAEEAQLTLADPVRLGWVLDETGEVYGGVGPNARLRLAARVTDIGPAAVDPATGHRFPRLLVTLTQAATVLGWGRPGARQAQLAAETARERWGLPTARPAAIDEIPTDGMRLS